MCKIFKEVGLTVLFVFRATVWRASLKKMVRKMAANEKQDPCSMYILMYMRNVLREGKPN